MKRIFTLLISTIIVYGTYAQIAVSDYEGHDLTNTTAFLPSDSEYHFQITNNGSSEITFILEVTEFSIPGDATGIAVCACGACFPISSVPVNVGSPTILAAGDTYGEEGNPDGELADVDYTSNGSTGQAYITIHIYEEGNESNSVEFTLDTEYSDIRSISSGDMNIYPNPAYSNFTVKINEKFIGSDIVFTNVLGKVVFSDKITNAVTNYDTDNFAKGLYFYTIMKGGKTLGTKKLIVK